MPIRQRGSCGGLELTVNCEPSTARVSPTHSKRKLSTFDPLTPVLLRLLCRPSLHRDRSLGGSFGDQRTRLLREGDGEREDRVKVWTAHLSGVVRV